MDSIAVGIKTLDELEMDLAIFEGRDLIKPFARDLSRQSPAN